MRFLPLWLKLCHRNLLNSCLKYNTICFIKHILSFNLNPENLTFMHLKNSILTVSYLSSLIESCALLPRCYAARQREDYRAAFHNQFSDEGHLDQNCGSWRQVPHADSKYILFHKHTHFKTENKRVIDHHLIIPSIESLEQGWANFLLEGHIKFSNPCYRLHIIHTPF